MLVIEVLFNKFETPEHRVWGAHEAFPQILEERVPTSHRDMIAVSRGREAQTTVPDVFLLHSVCLSIHPFVGTCCEPGPVLAPGNPKDALGICGETHKSI